MKNFLNSELSFIDGEMGNGKKEELENLNSLKIYNLDM